ncbi:hypothetical protein [Chryseobacterium lathyri]|uniref:Pentapeptide MXKDX repeat protein n=1 Tax=Chryseobacterium lathyri TaxID=395933 RepID=A0ABT9SGS8_9FLAO|nr:hypothetical protein [Chryseobacterium lathyri]MDP9958622.1 hypothetical protein [Chryseobacterium lathyri]MDQ0066655.1 hypothetical protein [Chryseobacterium lathyri]
MKKLILATALLVGTVAVSAQVTPQKRDTMRSDTTKSNRDMRNDNSTMNNNNNMDNTNSNNGWDKAKTDTTNSKNRDAVKGDRKMKKKN